MEREFYGLQFLLDGGAGHAGRAPYISKLATQTAVETLGKIAITVVDEHASDRGQDMERCFDYEHVS